MALETAVDVATSDDATPAVSFATEPARYAHWHLSLDGAVATLTMDVDELGGLRPGYAMKLNSYDLGVDIELHDAVQRLRFEHPEVGCVIITSAKDRCFSAGANIGMLAQASHPWKVNFCKFTNETRREMEDATAHSGQTYIAAVNGAAAGGGYELALACDEILFIDDGSSAVSLPELPLLAVLPATGGLTRLGDKRHVRRDLADVFVTKSEGVKAPTALRWGLIDAAIARGQFDEAVRRRAASIAAQAFRSNPPRGVGLEPLAVSFDDDAIAYDHLSAALDRRAGVVTLTIAGPTEAAPSYADGARSRGCAFWPLAVARELDDAILHLRTNELTLGTWVIRTAGDMNAVLDHDRFLLEHRETDWFVNEVTLLLKRVFKRLDVTSRSLLASIEPGSCFGGLLLEIALACDQQFMLDGAMEEAERPAVIAVTGSNLGMYPMGNELSRLESRFFGSAPQLDAARATIGTRLDAAAASELGLVTVIPDAIDWEDELRMALEQRASFSPDALTGMEANLRFCGPETMETKIFGRLTAWQNWVFSRPNAIGPAGALRRYGTGQRATLNKERV
ncbi:MAG: 2,3-epoxybenzoyl-CoA dihydrolase [Candidatus Dormiibacterota bacterium]